MATPSDRAVERLRRLRLKIDNAIAFFEGSNMQVFRPTPDPLPQQVMILGEFLIVEIEPARKSFDLVDELNQLRDAATKHDERQE